MGEVVSHCGARNDVVAKHELAPLLRHCSKRV